jgi:hypothetical protein
LSSRCVKVVRSGGFRTQCSPNAVVAENGHHWCKQHAPSAVRARQEAANERFERKWAEREAEKAAADKCREGELAAVALVRRIATELLSPFEINEAVQSWFEEYSHG